MSYGRDRDAHTRGVGAIAAADHMRARKALARRRAAQTAIRDARMAGLTYGSGGGLSGYGALQQLGAIKVTGSSMQSIRQPVINYGGNPEAPPAPPQRTFNPLAPNIGTVGPAFQPSNPTAPPLRPVMMPGRPTNAPTRAPVFVPVPTTGNGFNTSGGSRGGVITTSGGGTIDTGTSSSDGSGAGVVTGGGGVVTGGSTSGGGGAVTGGGGSDGGGDPGIDPGTLPADSTIAGIPTRTALLVGGGLVAAYLLFGRKR